MKDIKKDIEETLNKYDMHTSQGIEGSIDVCDEWNEELMDTVVQQLTDYITENYQPKTTSTDIEELKKEFEKLWVNEHGYANFCCESYKHTHKEDMEKVWNFFAPHLSNKSELKSAEHIKREAEKEAVWNFGEWLKRYTKNDRELFEQVWNLYLSQLNKEEE